MEQEELYRRLKELQDIKYRDFQRKLIPELPPERISGVRTPELRKLAKELGEQDWFLAQLPHSSFEENQLHAFIISDMKDFEGCIRRLDEFLPYVDNWATCDQISAMVFKKHTAELLPHIRRWIASGKTYTVRFGIGCLMTWYLDGEFRPEYLELAAGVHSGEYYVKMMVAWYFATALAKQYEAALPWLEKRRLEEWTRRKTIQKAIESYRVTDEHKEYLRSIR